MISCKENKIKNAIKNGTNNENKNLSKMFLELTDSINLQENFKKQSSYNFIKNYNYYMLKKICCDFNKKGIKYIVLKGCVLSQLLYDNPRCRLSSDIDIYIFEEYVNDAIQYMLDMGFVNTNTNVSHHYIFHNNKCCIEIHKTIIEPNLNIDEEYFKSCITQYFFEGQIINSLSITATLVYLFYHLYMHSCGILNLRIVYENGRLQKSKCFLYRSQEIALFVKKYIKEINWLEFYNEINSQKLNIVFKFMLLELMKIFPKIIPSNLSKKLLEKDYLELYGNLGISKLLSQRCNCSKYEDTILIQNHIDENWNLNCTNIIKEHNAYRFADNTNSFSAEFYVFGSTKKLKIQFKIYKSEMFFSPQDDFNTLNSDGVHLLFCSTLEYTYNSIFLFPKIIGNVCNVFVYDCLSNTLIDSQFIEAAFNITEYGYDLIVEFKEKFFEDIRIANFIYLGVIVADCNEFSNGRKSSLIHTQIQNEWFDPIHFLKINI